MRIGIVNDVALAREALRRVVESRQGLEVAWLARDGAEAVMLARKDSPDLILMDLFMPRMDGVEATRQIMATRPCAILVVTATVTGHIHKVYEAMGHGALDAVDTPSLGSAGLQGAPALLAKIETIGKLIGNPSGLHVLPAAGHPSPIACDEAPPLILLGASTGGPGALKQIVGSLPRDLEAGIVVVQHVDAAFADGLASWLKEQCRWPIELIGEGQMPVSGKVLLTATNDHLILDEDGRLHYVAEPAKLWYRPSVDVLFSSVASHGPAWGVAVLLTGMGRDGAQGLLRLRQRGWHTIAQDEQTSVVWGMPRAAAECGAAVEVLSVHKIASAITEQIRTMKGR